MAFQPEEDLTCPVCQDIFKAPVVLTCSHSFCKVCLRRWWTEKPSQECPVCMRRASRSDPPLNLALRNLCEAYRQQQTEKKEQVCPLHSETFKLFCESDQRPVCVVCRDSKDHRHHQVRPIDEATKRCKEDLQKALNLLKERLELVEQFKENCELSLAHIKTQSDRTASQIEKEFLRLHDFLSQQQESRMKVLKMEEKRKTQRIKDKMEAVSREIEALSETIKATEEQLRATDVSFLLEYKASVERVQRCPLQEELQLGPGALIDEAKHLGNLVFNIWSSMKTLVEYRPFVLDPNTAQQQVVLSSDLTRVSHDGKKNLPDNPERFEKFLSVLGSEAFDSGAHSWVVGVEKNSNWLLGVVSESFRRKGSARSDSGLWRISLCSDEFYAFSMSSGIVKLYLKNKPTKIRISLDFKKWKLSFCDADTNTCIHTFTYNFNEKIYPLFNTTDKAPLVIEPQDPPETNQGHWWWFY